MELRSGGSTSEIPPQVWWAQGDTSIEDENLNKNNDFPLEIEAGRRMRNSRGPRYIGLGISSIDVPVIELADAATGSWLKNISHCVTLVGYLASSPLQILNEREGAEGTYLGRC